MGICFFLVWLFRCMVPGIWMANHLNNEQVNVCYSDVYAIEMFTIQILTVALISCLNIGLNTEHGNTEHFEVQISNSSVLEWSVQAIAMVPTIPKPNHWQSEQKAIGKPKRTCSVCQPPILQYFYFWTGDQEPAFQPSGNSWQPSNRRIASHSKQINFRTSNSNRPILHAVKKINLNV